MALGTVEVPINEYNKLVELKGKVHSFENYMKEHEYIDKKDCAIILGLRLLENKKDKNNDVRTD